MNYKKTLATVAVAAFASFGAQAQTEIQWWHSMSGALGEWIGDIAKDFNGKQKDYKIVPVFKGNYDESMTAAVAAFRAGNAPHILQVFEVGTATMMASKGVVVPAEKIMRDAGYKFDPQILCARRVRLLHSAQRPNDVFPVQQLNHRDVVQRGCPKGSWRFDRQAASNMA